MSGGSGGFLTQKRPKDWHSSKFLHKRARYLLAHPEDQIPSDVAFLVGDGNREPKRLFKCHKFILAMVSSMLQAMFYGTFPQNDETVVVPDVSPTAFQHMLNFAYGDTSKFDDKINLEELLDLLYCAKSYLIEKLEQACRSEIQYRIGTHFDQPDYTDDPLVILEKAPQIDENNLASLALVQVSLDTVSVMNSDGFLGLSPGSVKKILDQPNLSASETQIYQEVRRWAEHKAEQCSASSLRDIVGSLVYSIRFPLFKATELANGPVKDGILSGDEGCQIFQYLFAKEKPNIPFLTEPRVELPDLWTCCFDFRSVHRRVSSRIKRTEDRFHGNIRILMRPDLAPECCGYLEKMIEESGRIMFRSCATADYADEQEWPLPAAAVEERNAFSHSTRGACWLEWDSDQGDGKGICKVRIAAWKKPDANHSAVFGFLIEDGRYECMDQEAFKRFDLRLTDDKFIDILETK